MATESKGPGFFAGLVFGSIIGAVLGLMFAPQPGDKTREQLQTKLDEFVTLGKSAWDEGKRLQHSKGMS